MAVAFPITSASRRAILSGLAFFPLVAATAVPAFAETNDPVLTALEVYAQARADHNLACEEYGRLEEAHREIRFYRPRVPVISRTVFGLGEAPDYSDEVCVYSEEDITRFGYTGDKAERIAVALKADRARHEADLERVGLTAADKASDEALERFCKAERAVLTAVPTTDEGAIELANFAAMVAEDDNPDELMTAIRTLGDWLIKRRRDRLQA